MLVVWQGCCIEIQQAGAVNTPCVSSLHQMLHVWVVPPVAAQIVVKEEMEGPRTQSSHVYHEQDG